MKKTLILILFILVFCYCNSSNDSEVNPFTIKGTCYLDDEPQSGIEIDFGIAKADQEKEITFDSAIKTTESDGTYQFERNLLKGNYQYRIRARDPVTNAWSAYQQKAALIGQTVTKDFYFWSE